MTDPIPLRRHKGFTVRLGFVPLLDSAPLIIARELGLFFREGLDVELVREASWASLRDKISFGLLDGAHMLAPMPMAMSLATDRPRTPITMGMVLSRNGNGITVSSSLYPKLVECGADPNDPLASAKALVEVAQRRGSPIQLASVAPWSSHDLQLRDWVAAAGPDARNHLQIVPVSPVQMEDAFRAGAIEGCCVGEPWNSLLEWQDLGVILHAGHQIWQNSPEKVLGMRKDWADQHTEIHQRLIRVLLRACQWLDNPEHHAALRDILSDERYLGNQVKALDGHPFSLFHPRLHQHFFRDSANFPWLSQAHWLATRLARWGQLDEPSAADIRGIVKPALFRKAARSMGIDAPRIDAKTEGHHRLPYVLEGGDGPVNISGDSLLGEHIHHWPG
ncbi:CmpA/NrtA family ABC transporter substrate-binding protein [Marinobacter nanhaiticus D15-8W]|uniref:Nitrate transporter n=1 Tax=Marinobacter nanhaiticus D15-8W TaxID=626887 RepID=N6VXN5_9GAMM|nr:CmpA/NrtA family ABC transporter substrate-binding protein [Marinobacter nanhaiticus]ENO15035.1 nitrate transporter [Marinobacter nanhaiticus D15-8W]BES69265.1 CmpA/NrtA family ABC transporter substrate-binding protein [Marinobacter nanhaiticus D15-8W]